MFKFLKNTYLKIAVTMITALVLVFGWQPLRGELVSRNDNLEPSQKHESIFANLDHYGNLLEMFAVNSFVKPDDIVVDYGNYAQIINLTSDSTPDVLEDRIVFSDAGDGTIFRYQGNVKNTELPWDFKISYFLNGKSIEAQELAGASGKLRLNLDAAYNPGAHPYFTENFMVQIRIPLRMDQTSEIKAPDASVMFVGNTVTVAFTLMPESTGRFSLEADVSDFSMDAIEIAAMKAVVPVNNDIDEIETGFDNMADGTQELIEGTEKLERGMVELYDGAGELFDGSADISEGIYGLSSGLNEFSGGLLNMETGLENIVEGSEAFNQALNAMSNALPQMAGGFKNIENGLDSMIANKDQLNALATSLSQSQDPQVRMLAEAMMMQLAGLSELQEGLSNANEGLSSHAAGISEITTRFGEFSMGLQQSAEGAQQINRSFGEIREASKSLSSGAVSLSDGLGELKDNISTLPEDVNKLTEGQRELKEGVLLAGEEMRRLTAGGEKADTVSFIAPDRADAETVQFIMRTPAIEKEEIEQIDEYIEGARDFWDRLIDLFRKLADRFF